MGKPIDEMKLLEVSKISKRNFRKLKKVLVKTDRNYCTRDRVNSILNLIFKVTEDHQLEMEFYHATKDLLKKLWNYISNTKDTVVVGVICSIVALCHYKDKINVSNICETLNIRMSTIQSQIRQKIVEPFQIFGFQKLVRDSRLLNIVLDKLGLSQNEECKAIEAEDKAIKITEKETHDKKSAEIVFLEWEDMIANSKDQQSIEFHIFAVKANHRNNFKVFIFFKDEYQRSDAIVTIHDKNTLKRKNLYFGKDPP